MYSEFLKINLLLVLVLITVPAEITLAFDEKNSSIETYSPGVLAIIRENEKLLDQNLDHKVILNLKQLVEKKSLNNFEKCSLYFLLGTAYFKLNDLTNSNKIFLNILAFERIPLLLHLESLKRLSVKTLNKNQKEYVKAKIRKINDKQSSSDLQIELAKFFYDCMEFDQAIKILDAVVSENRNLTSAQINKLNELLFLSYIGNSDLSQALQLIELTVEKEPTKKNFRLLAYIYALINDKANHLNIWETMYDNFLLDNYETKYFYELLLKRGFYLRARQVFSYGIKNDYFGLKDKKHGDLQNEWIEQFITDKNQ